MLPPNDSAYAQLVEAIRRGPLALVGTGLSMACNYPSWSTLLEELQAEADVINPRSPKSTAIVSSMNDKLWEAQEYRDRIGPGRYRTYLSDRFKPNGHPLSESIKKLVQLPFKSFITTNYDALLSQAIVSLSGAAAKSIVWNNQFAIREFFHELNDPSVPHRTVLHLHGRYDDPDSIILTEFDYVSQYAANDTSTRRLFALFSTQCLVFMGFSLSDPDLMLLLRQVQATLGHGRPRHFAILPLKDPNHELQSRRYLEQKYGIIPCFYVVIHRNNADGTSWDDHSALDILLGRLFADLGLGVATPTPAAPMLAAPMPVAKSPAKMADPHKGDFGGRSEANDRRLGASVSTAPDRVGWFSITLTVESTDTTKPLAGSVTFLIHPSFRKPQRNVTVAPDGKATLRLLSYGAFTVGAMADGGVTRLELDLSELPSVPAEFKTR